MDGVKLYCDMSVLRPDLNNGYVIHLGGRGWESASTLTPHAVSTFGALETSDKSRKQKKQD